MCERKGAGEGRHDGKRVKKKRRLNILNLFNILFVFASAVSPSSIEDTGIHISCRECIRLIQ